MVFRAKRADRIKVLVWDGNGLVLTYKRLEAGSSPGRRSRTVDAAEGAVRGPVRRARLALGGMAGGCPPVATE
ncbi:MAG: IS66 family insertion sequence element accessory protein TnpB [Alphaproteobacteria bacterium]|nr:IS66 family insertion sequence element accessory protein TnpB [Alphaproteobacteria bacterium]